jgi:hypothetical protein
MQCTSLRHRTSNNWTLPITAHHSTAPYHQIRYDTIQYNALQCQYNAIQYDAILYYLSMTDYCTALCPSTARSIFLSSFLSLSLYASVYVTSSSCPYSCPCSDGIAHDVIWSSRRCTQHACLLLPLPLARFSSLRPYPLRCVSFLLDLTRFASPRSAFIISLHRLASLWFLLHCFACPLFSTSYSILFCHILVQTASSSTTQRTAT